MSKTHCTSFAARNTWVTVVCSVLAVATHLGAQTTTPTSCSGTSVRQAVTNVTTLMTSTAPGVVVRELTNNGSNGVTYIDVPPYSAAANRLIYNHLNGSMIMTAGSTGSGSQAVSAMPAQDAFFTFDGSFAYYIEGVAQGGATDIFAIPVTQTGRCTPIRVTNLNMIPVYPLPQVEVSTSGKQSDGTNVVAFSPDNFIRRVVLESGALLGSPVDPPDLYQGNTYHRIRLNPVFPQWVAYKRNGAGTTGTPETWLYNFDTGELYSVAPLGTPVGHQVWSPNGRQLGYINPNQAQWNVANVFNPDGTLALNSSGAFTNTLVGPNIRATGLDSDYCNWAPDGSVLVCTSGVPYGAKVYLMSLDGTKTKFLSTTNATGATIWGVPSAHFFMDDLHIIFNSDRTGSPEVYTVSGFTTSFTTR